MNMSRGNLKCLFLRSFVILGFSAFALGCFAHPSPQPRAHAHNDYEHPRPLLDALDHGFCSVEADIYLVDGKLLVAHDLKDVKPERTLEALYLAPLWARVKANGGWVFQTPQPVLLLIDFKSEAEATYAALRPLLEKYSDILTEFPRSGSPKPVMAVISGSRPTATVAGESRRRAAIDGRPADLEGTSPPDLMPLISQSWTALFKWRGEGAMPETEKAALKSLVEKTHGQGRKLRFWATPEKREVWEALYEAGVDFINTDDLPGLQAFLIEKTKTPGAEKAP